MRLLGVTTCMPRDSHLHRNEYHSLSMCLPDTCVHTSEDLPHRGCCCFIMLLNLIPGSTTMPSGKPCEHWIVWGHARTYFV